ncbi:transmembrane protein, putative [Medicago truncatula]|uniref:Transmembrane protein, putative n=1 Tax=Medicago truncatula TaxID=3880 RepID=G7I439_MEDTR|nr:transmembrane protein, putative [Medicago truncatula]
MKTINRTGSKKLGESLLLRHRHRRCKEAWRIVLCYVVAVMAILVSSVVVVYISTAIYAFTH